MEADKRGSGYSLPNRWGRFVGCTTLSMKCLKNRWQEGVKGELEAPYNLWTNVGSSAFSTCGWRKSQTCQQWPMVVWGELETPVFRSDIANREETLTKKSGVEPQTRSNGILVTFRQLLHPDISPAVLTLFCHWKQICQDERARQKRLRNSPSL